MTTPQPDWEGLIRAITARRRPIMEGLADFLRHDTVTQNPEGVRAGAEWLSRAMQARGLMAAVMEAIRRAGPAWCRSGSR